MPSIKQKSALDVIVEQNGPRVISLTGDISAGSTIVVAAASYNYQESGTVISAVTDEDSNVYGSPKLRIESGASSHGFIEVFVAENVPAKAGGIDVTISYALSNGYNKSTIYIYEIDGVATSSIDATVTATGTAGPSATSDSATMAAAPSQDGALVMGFAQCLWSDAPANWTLPTGYSVVDTVNEAPDARMLLQVCSKVQGTAAADVLTWGHVAQTYGGSCGVLAFLPSTAAVQTVNFEVDADAINAASPLASVFEAAPSTNYMHGPLLFQAYGSDVSVGTALNGSGKIDVSVTVPSGQSLSNSQSVIAAARGTNPADSNNNWGTHFVPATVSGANPWELTVSGTVIQDVNSSTIKLRGLNAYAGSIPYHLPLYYENNNAGAQGNMHEVVDFSSLAGTISFLKAQFGSTFNCVRILVSPLAFKQTIPGTYDYPSNKTRMDSVAQICENEGIWLVVCPYGMGKYGDFESRALKNQPGNDPNKANDDGTQPNGEDGSQDETNSLADSQGNSTTIANSWLTTENNAFLNDLATWAVSKPNVLVQTLNEPRTQTDATWQAQQLIWIATIRAKLPKRPILVHGPNWATNLPAAGVAAIRAADSNVIFAEDHYSDQGSAPANESMWADYSAAISAGACVGVAEWGPSFSGANYGQPIAAYQTWAETYHSNMGGSIPIKLAWMALWDNNSLFDDPIASGQDVFHTGYYNVYNNPNSRALNLWATSVVIPQNAL